MRFDAGRWSWWVAVRQILVVALLGVLAGCGGGGGGGGNDNGPPPEPAARSLNHLNVTIVDAEIDDDRRPVVRFTLTDENGGPVEASGVRIRLVIAVLDPESHEYRDYLTTVQTSPDTNVSATQSAAEDSATGTLQDLGGGRY